MHAYEVPVHKIYAREMHAYEMQAHKVQACERYTRDMRSTPVRYTFMRHTYEMYSRFT
jgi:hypothetical protein